MVFRPPLSTFSAHVEGPGAPCGPDVRTHVGRRPEVGRRDVRSYSRVQEWGDHPVTIFSNSGCPSLSSDSSAGASSLHSRGTSRWVSEGLLSDGDGGTCVGDKGSDSRLVKLVEQTSVSGIFEPVTKFRGTCLRFQPFTPFFVWFVFLLR